MPVLGRSGLGWINSPYVVAVVLMAGLGCTASVILVTVRPSGDNNLEIIVLIFGFLAPTTAALLSFMKAEETHLSVNSRLDKWIESSGDARAAAGKEEGRKEAEQRADVLAEKRPHGPRATDDLPGAVGGRRAGDGRT